MSEPVPAKTSPSGGDFDLHTDFLVYMKWGDSLANPLGGHDVSVRVGPKYVSSRV